MMCDWKPEELGLDLKSHSQAGARWQPVHVLGPVLGAACSCAPEWPGVWCWLALPGPALSQQPEARLFCQGAGQLLFSCSSPGKAAWRLCAWLDLHMGNHWLVCLSLSSNVCALTIPIPTFPFPTRPYILLFVQCCVTVACLFFFCALSACFLA